MTGLAPGNYGDLAAPVPDPRDLSIGQVHLGLGAFHRAHQAVYTTEAMAATGDHRWGIAAFTQRRPDAARILHAQQGLYTVVETGPGSGAHRIIPAILEAADGSDDTGTLLARLCDPQVQVVTLTVTEKGYRHDPVTRRLNMNDPLVQADLGSGQVHSVPGILAHALHRRAVAGATPLTIVSCDNLPDNGGLLRGLVTEFASAAGLDIDGGATFPATMVDRIVPATTRAMVDEFTARHGVTDAALVMCEPFRQWVISNDFAGPVPAWAQVGATLVADTANWESLKLRVLNASHSILAYLGLRLGYHRISDAVSDAALAQLCTDFINSEVSPTIEAPEGVSASEYGAAVLSRFTNPALPHTTAQVASDGSQKIGPRLFETVTRCRAAGITPRHAALGVAGWVLHVREPQTADGVPTELVDPLAADLRSLVAGASAADAAQILLRDRRIASEQLADDAEFVSLVAEYATNLDRHGRAALITEVTH
ncbi:MAG: mannitol dehydrogenase family protein [Gordonia sp. (in: high G+C Gram-positive bacteria)]